MHSFERRTHDHVRPDDETAAVPILRKARDGRRPNLDGILPTGDFAQLAKIRWIFLKKVKFDEKRSNPGKKGGF